MPYYQSTYHSKLYRDFKEIEHTDYRGVVRFYEENEYQIQQLDEQQVRTLSLEQKDRWWLENVFRGDMPQLTLRSAVTGMLLGGVLSLTNLYIGIQTGWTLGVGITSVILAFAAFKALSRIGLGSEMTILENNCMQSTASAAGYTTSAALVTAVPAYMLITGVQISPIWLVLWTFFTSLLGLCIFVGVKRQLLHYERLAWPSSVAAAQTLRSLHERGRDAVDQARWLFGAASVAAAIQSGSSVPATQISCCRRRSFESMAPPASSAGASAPGASVSRSTVSGVSLMTTCVIP